MNIVWLYHWCLTWSPNTFPRFVICCCCCYCSWSLFLLIKRMIINIINMEQWAPITNRFSFVHFLLFSVFYTVYLFVLKRLQHTLAHISSHLFSFSHSFALLQLNFNMCDRIRSYSHLAPEQFLKKKTQRRVSIYLKFLFQSSTFSRYTKVQYRLIDLLHFATRSFRFSY